MNISIPELSLIIMVGASGSGKSTFAQRHFAPTEVVASDYCRALVSGDAQNQAASKDAFEVLHHVASIRLRAGLLTVVDATSIQPEDRKGLVQIAREHDCPAVAVVLDMPLNVCLERNQKREDHHRPDRMIRNQHGLLRRQLKHLKRDGFHKVDTISSPEEAGAAVVERIPLWTDRFDEHGPFDIIGDVHGCYDELTALMEQLGYHVDREKHTARHPEGRKIIFVGDLVDRGPGSGRVLAMNIVQGLKAHCVVGNHEDKLLRKLRGRDVKVSHGLASTLEQLDARDEEFRQNVEEFLNWLPHHLRLDDGNLVVAHAGIKQEYQGRTSRRVRGFCLYGETTGESDEYGLPVRANWAADYRGEPAVVYGHTPVLQPVWLNNTINIDTGAVFGGKLTALRYPERELVSVPAGQTYYEPAKPIQPAHAAMGNSRPAHLLDVSDLTGKQIISTTLDGNITIREKNTAAALEVMSRYALDPRLLAYIPPTISPCETSRREGYLEHPDEALAYYRENGVTQIICEEKHMGSRGIILATRDDAIVAERFGIEGYPLGACYSRTGRGFFIDPEMGRQFLTRTREALQKAGIWDELDTRWLILDAEIMPWSYKAHRLIRSQYAAVGAAAQNSLGAEIDLLRQTTGRGLDTGTALDTSLENAQSRLVTIERYRQAYANYCWPVNSINDVKLAPFHVLASEGKAHTDEDHGWHMTVGSRLAQADPLLFKATDYRRLDLEVGNPDEIISWWEQMTKDGGEGMVVKPLAFVPRNAEGRLVQPAVKCRGKEYLRIIYGPEYDRPDQLGRLRRRSLNTKRALAIREFALGLGGLDRFVAQEPLYRVHQCAFAVLALESEPVDQRL